MRKANDSKKQLEVDKGFWLDQPHNLSKTTQRFAVLRAEV